MFLAFVDFQELFYTPLGNYGKGLIFFLKLCSYFWFYGNMKLKEVGYCL